jgi:sporulation protein YlmC with PRC-barrel domain
MIKRRETMKTLIYSLTGLFVISLFVIGSSLAGEMRKSGEQSAAACLDTFKASDVIGLNLQDTAGDRIGTITDVAVDPSSGRINSFLINDIEGVGGAVVAIPLSDIQMWGETTFVYGPSEHMYRFSRSTDGLGVGESPYVAYNLGNLEHAGQGYYESREWTDADPMVCSRHRYYGLAPYWESE